jgi:hypothetical protein
MADDGRPVTELAPSAPRSRPPAATLSPPCGPGPSVFTAHAQRSIGRASVSRAAGRRGTPPLPAMSLGACRCWLLDVLVFSLHSILAFCLTADSRLLTTLLLYCELRTVE